MRPALRRRALASVAGLTAALLPLTFGAAQAAPASPPSGGAGSAGVVTGLPLTTSAVTDTVGSGPFAGLQVTVNQTSHLLNQAVSVTWKSAPPTWSSAPGTFAGNDYAADYLQVFQCWSPNAATAPTPEQCEFGGENVNQSAYPVIGLSNAYDRVLSQPGWTDFAALQAEAAADPTCATAACTSYLDPNSGLILEPFDAADGTVVPASVDYNYANTQPYKPFDTNPYFSYTTTNEVDFARTYTNGTGETLFQVDTGEQAPGLGCGEKALPDNKVPQCWLVVVPRGTPTQDNDPQDPDQVTVDTSPLSPAAWAQRITVPLQFDPVATGCSITAKPVYIQGGEPAANAVASWQPQLCATPGDPTYDYEAGPETSARLSVVDPSPGSAGMGVITEPLDSATVEPTHPVDYAPLTLSGITIAFTIQRVPALDSQGEPVPAEAPLAGTRVAHINLTPRLVAKLLTESYQDQFFGGETSGSAYTWLQHNPSSLLTDPDFLQYNPEFQNLQAVQQWDDGDIIVESPTSDEATELWSWILADPAARAWLDGQPDPWGMRVNPYYSLSPTLNPAHASIDNPPLDSYPKDDPYCWTPPDAPSYEILTGQLARELCFSDWEPYTASAQAAAEDALATSDGAKTTFNQGVIDPNAAWSANGPQEVGQAFVMAVTDTADAARYGLQTASLSAAGDDGPDPTFVAPTDASLRAAAGAMEPSPVAGVAQPDVSTKDPAAYPLPILTYAALSPSELSASERADYATFLRYAVGPGQVSGTSLGQLPLGYVPLSAQMVATAKAVATALTAPVTPPTTSSTTPSTTPSTASPVSVDPSSPAPTVAAPTAASSPTTPTTPPAKSASPPVTRPAGAGAASTTTTTAAPSATRRVALAVATPGTPIGAVRLAVPVTLGAGVVALVGAPLLGLRRRRRPRTDRLLGVRRRRPPRAASSPPGAGTQ